MNLAPVIELNTTPGVLKNGLPGIFQTVALMRGLVRAGRINPIIRQATISTIFLTPEKDEYAEVEACFNYVRDHIRYVKDIYAVETIATPDKTLACKIGDCDDQSVLLASMLECIGYPTRFICAGYSHPDVLEHVYLQVVCHGEWINCDATEQHPMGYAPPLPVCLFEELV